MSNLTTSISRMIKLTRVEWVTVRKSLYITFGCIAGIAFLRSFGTLNVNEDFHHSFFGPALFLGGAIFTSFAFRELKEGPRAVSYMLIPGNLFEKFMAKFLVISIGYALATTGVYFVGSTLGEGIRQITIGTSHGVFNPFKLENILIIWGYIPFSIMFLYGAVRFKSYHFLKTVLGMIVIMLVFGLLVTLAFRIIFNSYFDGMTIKSVYIHMGVRANHLGIDYSSTGQTPQILKGISHFFMHVVFPGLILWASFQRLKETEV